MKRNIQSQFYEPQFLYYIFLYLSEDHPQFTVSKSFAYMFIFLFLFYDIVPNYFLSQWMKVSIHNLIYVPVN